MIRSMFSTLFSCGTGWSSYDSEKNKNPDAAFAATSGGTSAAAGDNGGGPPQMAISTEDKAKYESNLNNLRTKIQDLESQIAYWQNTEIPQYVNTAEVCGEQGPRGRAAAVAALKSKRETEAKVETTIGILTGLRNQLTLMLGVKDTAETAQLIKDSGAIVGKIKNTSTFDVAEVHKTIDEQKQHSRDLASMQNILSSNKGTARPVLEEDVNNELDELLAQKAARNAARPPTLASVAAPYAATPPPASSASASFVATTPPAKTPVAAVAAAAAPVTYTTAPPSSSRPTTTSLRPPPSAASWDQVRSEL